MTFGSLFAGIGGFDLGFERAGMVCKWQVELDDYATRVLEKHWPSVHKERDIRECGKHNLEWVDVICGGFPCQDISYAGRGAGIEGERSGLFFDAVRVVSELRPRFVVLENVAALLVRGLDRVLGELAQIGFDAEWHCIPAAAVGAPHIRDRVFVVAYAESMGWSTRCRKPGDEIETRSGGRKSQRSDQILADALRPAIGQGTGRWGIWKGDTQQYAGHWATEPDVGRVADGVPARMDRLRGLGNAVVPQVAEWIGRQVMEATK